LIRLIYKKPHFFKATLVLGEGKQNVMYYLEILLLAKMSKTDGSVLLGNIFISHNMSKTERFVPWEYFY
jgi:hypothetical protein